MYPFDLPDQPASLIRKQSNQIVETKKRDDNSNNNSKVPSELITTIKGISLPKLIEKIVLHGEKEKFATISKKTYKLSSLKINKKNLDLIPAPCSEYKEMQAYFLACYRNLCKPLELAKLLKLRYTGPDINATKHQISYFATNKNIIRPRAMDFFSDFVDSLHGSDFAGEDAEELYELINNFSTDYDCLTQGQLLRLLALRKRGHAMADPGKTLSVTSYKSSETDVQPQLSVDDIVHEIIAQEFVLFSKIHPSEFLSLAWSTKHKKTKAPTITRLIEIFNWVTTWVSTRILMCTTPEARSSLIEFFISVAMRMKQLNNLNGVMEVESALNSTPIARLHQSWALISKESMDDFAHLTELMDCFQNFKNYRQYLAQIDANVPCLPYVGLLLADITFICEGNSAYVEPGLINIHYVKMLGTTLSDIARYQTNRYQLPTPASSIYMEVAYNSDDLYQLSKLREDKKQLEVKGGKTVRRQMPKQAGRRTLSNTDFVPRVPPPTSEDRHILTANGKVLNVKPGELIFDAEHRNDHLYYVASGKVSLGIITGAHPHSENIAEIEKHQFFGLVSFLDNGSAWHYAVAVEPCTIVEIQRQLVNQVLEYDVDFASRIYKCFANMISDLIRRAQALLSKIRKLERATEDDKSDTSSNPSHSLPQTPTSPPASPAFRGGALTPASSSSPLQILHDRHQNDLSSSQEKLSGRLFNISQVALKVYECKFKVFSGTLYIFPSYICFYAKVFGFAKKIVLYCTNITEVAGDPGDLSFTVQETSSKKYKFQLGTEEDQKEATGFSKTIMNKKNAPPSSPGTPHTTTVSISTSGQFAELQQVPENQSTSSVLSESEWMLLLNGAQHGTFPPGHVFIKEGSRPSGIFQIVKGVCGIQVDVDGKAVNLAKRKNGELFGEMSFLDESAVASASVVAITEVEVYSLHESFANVLLNAHSGIAPKFYHYIGLVLVARLRELDTSRR